jgi:hypothetical protein
MRQMQPEVGRRKWRRDAEHLTDPDPHEHGDERDGQPLVTHQAEHQRRDRHSEPDLRLDEPDPERSQRQPKTELQARCDAARQGACEAADDASDAEDQGYRADHETRPGNRCRVHRLDQHRR